MAEDPLTSHARARIGRTLRSKWTLDRLIGVGGMAAVYEATHRNGSKVAIKMLHPTLMYDTNFAARLVQEGYVANKINHPAAVRVHDDDTDENDGTVFLVMELLEGQTLSQARRKRKRFPAVEVFKMLDPVLECLASAHDKGIIHRDIKPENLFLTRDNQVRVLDFGIARMNDGTSNVTATRTGMVVGSPAYMSPEQALGKMNSVGPQTDVYAVGATMFALISGTTPHAGESTQEMIVMVATQAARPIATVAPDVPPAVARVLDKALAYDKDKRYPDARAMLADMRAAVAEIEGGPAPRVLPTFADDDDEGQTTVNSALKGSDSDPRPSNPLPAAGMNRVGARPPTGRFQAASPFGPPVAPPAEAAAPPPPTGEAPRMRPPTLAPLGAPPMAPPAALGPQPLAPPPGHSSGQQPVPSLGSGPHVAPVFPGSASGSTPIVGNTSGMSPAALGTDSNPGVNPGMPATMAMPTINPVDFGTPSAPGVASGQRPGATTNMAWAAAPPAPVAEAEPPPRKPRTGLIAAAAAAVLGLGVAGFFALSGNDHPTPAPTARPARPNPPPVAQNPPPAPQNPPAVPTQPQGATPDTNTAAAQPQAPTEAPAADAGAAPEPPQNVAQNTAEPTQNANAAPPAQDDANARTNRRRNREREGHGEAHDNAQSGDRQHRTNRNRNRNPLGY